MIYLLYGVHVICCIFLILVVLFQQGKGADLSVFGGGSTQAAFGARGAATLLHKLTVAFFVLFTLTTLSIGLFQNQQSQSSVMSDVAAEQPEDSLTTQPAEAGETGSEGTESTSGEPPPEGTPGGIDESDAPAEPAG